MWTEAAIPDQNGRRVVITGANGGLGAVCAHQLAERGAEVILACRNTDKGEAVRAHIAAAVPSAKLHVVALDLADLGSVATFAAEIADRFGAIDLLMNNAGIMAIPRRETKDGFEMQLGTNHIGHFALTARLLPLLQTGGRIINVSSQAHRMGRMNWADIMGQNRYNKWLIYGQSKLANLLFHFELDRRLRAHRPDLRAVAAHPGYSATNLQAVGPQLAGNAGEAKLMQLANRIVAQSAEMGALPSLRAATDPEVAGGDYFGPDGIGEMQGWPIRVGHANAAGDEAAAARLWDLSEQWTGLSFFDVAPDAEEELPDAIES
ncbi:MAG: SDR family oxidoreductase [Myxococcales bacterium]|nr:SDR family oxidoreductase [Myxococcales bacterium]